MTLDKGASHHLQEITLLKGAAEIEWFSHQGVVLEEHKKVHRCMNTRKHNTCLIHQLSSFLLLTIHSLSDWEDTWQLGWYVQHKRCKCVLLLVVTWFWAVYSIFRFIILYFRHSGFAAINWVLEDFWTLSWYKLYLYLMGDGIMTSCQQLSTWCSFHPNKQTGFPHLHSRI